MMISEFTCILGVLFLCKMQRAIIKNIWQKLPIASTVGVTESVRRISFGAGIANHMKLETTLLKYMVEILQLVLQLALCLFLYIEARGNNVHKRVGFKKRILVLIQA